MALPYKFQASTVIQQGRTTAEAVKEIKDWLETADLPRIPDELVVLFLLSCRNQITQTQKTLRAYFKCKSEAPEIFDNRDIDSESLRRARGVATSISIPRRLPNNGVIHFFKITDTNYRNFEWTDAMKLAFMLVDISQSSDPPEDLTVVIDMKGLSFMHLTRLKLGTAKKFLDFLQEGMPLKIKTIHILNTSYILDKLLWFAKAFIRGELMSIIKQYPVDADLSDFYKECLEECLPKEYGGKLPCVEEMNLKTIEQFRELKEFFRAEEKLRGVSLLK